MARTKHHVDYKAIRKLIRLHKAGWQIKQIAAELGFSTCTIEKWIATLRRNGMIPHTKRSSNQKETDDDAGAGYLPTPEEIQAACERIRANGGGTPVMSTPAPEFEMRFGQFRIIGGYRMFI